MPTAKSDTITPMLVDIVLKYTIGSNTKIITMNATEAMVKNAKTINAKIIISSAPMQNESAENTKLLWILQQLKKTNIAPDPLIGVGS